jgi:Second Messenger Oligonucleotide or Dinucleotide Synthetase domain
MLTVQDAFKKFRSRLELTTRNQADASRRQIEIRGVMDAAFAIERDFLTGSYARWTKTKPLKDVDIFCVLADKERHYRKKAPSILLADVENVLVKKYGRENVSCQRRSVTVSFGVEEVDGSTNGLVMSFDVVPAFPKGDHYEIPDTARTSGWTETNPEIHAEKAKEAQDAYDGEWKGLVRMMKSWNRYHDKPITPSFLIEVMALELLYPPFGGVYSREMQAFFHTLADRISETWPDPAGLGPDVSDSMTPEKCRAAREALLKAERQAAYAIQLERQGKIGDALRAWRELLGPRFPLS